MFTAYVRGLKTGNMQVYKNLAMLPLLSDASSEVAYLLLDEALDKHLIEVTELTEGGHVPELKVINKSDTMVLLLDGEELVGAKQNRIINTTILIAAKSTIIIPVSCVEQGRWSYVSNKFSSCKRVMSSDMRARKADQVYASRKARGTYHSDQSAIWNEISRKAVHFETHSPTMAMSDIYLQEQGSIDEYRKHFSTADRQVGALFLINGRVAGLDSFSSTDTLAKMFGKLVDSYALDAMEWLQPDCEIKISDDTAQKYLDSILSARIELTNSVALGSDLRLNSPVVTGFALIYETTILHLSAFARKNGQEEAPEYRRMHRFSQRRSNRKEA
ncbi:MAG: DUF6569 family protein [Pseudomonadota bacterium]